MSQSFKHQTDCRYFATHMSVLLFGLIQLSICAPAHATVIEWDESDKLTVSQGAIEKHQKPGTDSSDKTNEQVQGTVNKSAIPLEPLSAEQEHYRAMAREVALHHAGHPGIRKVGLSALQFVDLFEAMIHRESSFDPQTVSEDGAQGLGQLMPGTAKELGVTDPFDPEQNLKASARYFTGLLVEFGRIDLALAAYNAGPTRVTRLGHIPRILETQDHIAWILTKAGHPVPDMPLLAKETSIQSETSLSSNNDPAKAGAPLSGDISVWEF